MLAMTVGIAGFVILINMLSFQGINYQINRHLDMLEQYERSIYSETASIADDDTYLEVQLEIGYFTVVANGDEIVKINAVRIADIKTEDMLDYYSKAAKKGNNRYIDGYKFRRISLDNGYLIYIFINCDSEFYSFYVFTLSSIAIGFFGLALTFVLVVLLADKVTRPIKDSYEKQRSFVTDASHELKTPIAIIQANTDIIEMESGQSEWTEGIKHQTERLKKLTERLVYLSKMQEGSSVLRIEDFCISDTVLEVIEPYFAMAISNNSKIDLNIRDNVRIKADQEAIKQLVSLFMDNAMKYSNAGGKISVSIGIEAKHVKLVVSNTVDGIEIGKHDRLFDRFYRADNSRNSKTGGSGIGLSVAREIVEAHGGSVSAVSVDGKSIDFCVLLPR